MISRVVVPMDARINKNPPPALRKAPLVPRRLILADAKWSAIPELSTSYKAREMMIRELLVPAEARMGGALKSCGTHEQKVSAAHRLFHEALLNRSALGHNRPVTEWLISFAVHAVIVAAAVTLPLFITHTIGPHKLELTYLVVPSFAPVPPLPTAPAGRHLTMKSVVPVPAKLTMPIPLPKMMPRVVGNDETEASPEVAGVPGGVMGGVSEGQIGGLLSGILGETAARPSTTEPVVAVPAGSGPLRLGGEVRQPRKIYAPAPQYPMLARQGRIKGVVKIDAIVDKDGNVVDGRAVSGPALLITAALDAVKHWKYEPTYLNGVPWPIELTISVTFSLS